MRKLLLFVFFILLAGVGCSSPDYYQFGTGGQALLCVPPWEMDQNTLPDKYELVDLSIGKGMAPGFGFYYDGEYLKKCIPGFIIRKEFSGHTYVNALSGSIGLLGHTADLGHFNTSMYARNTKDMWYATGECKNRNIVRLDDTDLYRVKCKKDDDYSSIWNTMPEKNISLPSLGDLVVAVCRYEGIAMGPFSGYENHECRRVFTTMQYKIDYRIQEENLAVVEELDEFIKGQLQKWQENCDLKDYVSDPM